MRTGGGDLWEPAAANLETYWWRLMRLSGGGDENTQLARLGYRLKDMTEQFDAKAAEIRAMFSNQLEPKRTAEIRERMLAAGLPI